MDSDIIDDSMWPEWTDDELNNEQWDIPKNGIDGLFVDTQSVSLPSSLPVDQWIRAKNLPQLSAPLTVYTTELEYHDFVTNNKHILHSEFMRSFICTMIYLQDCGEVENFKYWQGWMNVYSSNKTGKQVTHHPVINPHGKYVIRLYFMGCWRRIFVDDTIPVDENKTPLLPRTTNNFELWPLLLAKALLKIASSSWTEKSEIVDFHPIACLTGWIHLHHPISHLSAQDKWNFIIEHAENYEEKQIKKTTRPMKLFLGIDETPNITLWEHLIYVTQYRDVPLDSDQKEPPLANWKRYRWLEWAIKRGIIDPVKYFTPIRYLKIVSPLMKTIPNKKFKRKTSIKNNHQIKRKTSKIIPNTNNWMDFNGLSSHLKQVHLFYKIQCFRYTFHTSFDRTNNNEPFYILSDSISTQIFLITISTISKNSVHLVIEKEKHSQSYEPLIVIGTNGTKTAIFELNPGRQLLKVSYRIENGCSILLGSNTKFYMGDRLTINRSMMTQESQRLDALSKSIKNHINIAFRSFGSNDYKKQLKILYRSYMPDNKNSLIHEYFIEELVRQIYQFNYLVSSLRIFFINPTIGRNWSLLKNQSNFHTIENEEEFSSQMENEQAVIVQSFFRMSLVKFYKNYHNRKHRKHGTIRKNLIKIIELIDVTQLTRNLIKRDIDQMYTCWEDLQYVLQVQEYEGTLTNVPEKSWFPIVRLNVNTQTPEDSVSATINLFINSKSYNLKIIDNDTKNIIPNVFSNIYRYSKKGYTIFAYGWNEFELPKTFNWTLHIVTIKGEPIFQPINNVPKLTIDTITNIYSPNKDDLIFKCIIEVLRNTLISLKLTISKESAQIQLRIIDDNDKIICEINGGRIIIVPSVILEYGTSTIYYVEAFVRNNSWPLTVSEWFTVNEMKTSNPKPTSLLWTLQIVKNLEDEIKIFEDGTRDREINLIKLSSTTNDPDRLQRGGILRKTFIEENTSTIYEASDLNETSLEPPPLYCYSSKVDLNTYMIKDDEEEGRWIITDQEEEVLRNQSYVNVMDAQLWYKNFLQELNTLLENQKRKYIDIFQDHQTRLDTYRSLIDNIYEIRGT